ncbi:PREDICTED: G2/mitotic-specific cyclin-B-like [Nicrophorus vespilloides]|uniref:G2/mitotic-specific cyclin-B-like n=1 Tax=Nicrophorus vespilloides TaxID=110193 RepID=A0ABM1MI60_NICVS|nr:PREDICTED: G2/mitotic-specific cyclin-B-like [Nicrophorus vespilloides]
MEARSRKIMTNINRENVSTRPGKPTVRPAVPSRRPVLGELGNQLSLQSNHNVALKKPIIQSNPLKSVQEIKVVKTNKPAILSREKEQFRTVVNPSKGVILKRQESNLLPIIKEINICKVEQSYSAKQLGVIDVDESQDDPMLVAEYIKDIMKYLMDLEIKYSIQNGFLNDDHKSTPKMRSVLINWMSEVHLNFKFLSETFHLSVATVDRYLQANKNIGRETLQLVGTSAMLVAGKYEENELPDISDFVYICDDSFSKKQILFMEGDILKRLEFSFGRPLSLHFLRRFNKIAKANTPHHTLGKYLLELALLEYGICHIKPSLQAAAACCLSISVLNELEPIQVWTKTLIHYSTYNYTDIKDTMAEFSAALVRAETSKFQAIRKKYASSQLSKMSLNCKLKGALVQRLASHAKILKT